jgi:hypothetical protein
LTPLRTHPATSRQLPHAISTLCSTVREIWGDSVRLYFPQVSSLRATAAMGRSRRLLQGHCGVVMRSLTNTMNLFGTDIYIWHTTPGESETCAGCYLRLFLSFSESIVTGWPSDHLHFLIIFTTQSTPYTHASTTSIR